MQGLLVNLFLHEFGQIKGGRAASREANTSGKLATGPRPGSPVELTLGAMFAYDWSSLYQALRRAEEQLAETIDQDDWLRRLRAARLSWLKRK